MQFTIRVIAVKHASFEHRYLLGISWFYQTDQHDKGTKNEKTKTPLKHCNINHTVSK